MSTTLFPIIIAAVFGGWAFMSLIGGERARRVAEAELVAAREAELARIAEAMAPRPSSSEAAKPAKPPIAKLPTPPPAKAQPAPANSKR